MNSTCPLFSPPLAALCRAHPESVYSLASATDGVAARGACGVGIAPMVGEAEWVTSNAVIGVGHHDHGAAQRVRELPVAGVGSVDAAYHGAANDFPRFERQKIRGIYDEAIIDGSKQPHPELLRRFPNRESRRGPWRRRRGFNVALPMEQGTASHRLIQEGAPRSWSAAGPRRALAAHVFFGAPQAFVEDPPVCFNRKGRICNQNELKEPPHEEKALDERMLRLQAASQEPGFFEAMSAANSAAAAERASLKARAAEYVLAREAFEKAYAAYQAEAGHFASAVRGIEDDYFLYCRPYHDVTMPCESQWRYAIRAWFAREPLPECEVGVVTPYAKIGAAQLRPSFFQRLFGLFGL